MSVNEFKSHQTLKLAGKAQRRNGNQMRAFKGESFVILIAQARTYTRQIGGSHVEHVYPRYVYGQSTLKLEDVLQGQTLSH